MSKTSNELRAIYWLSHYDKQHPQINAEGVAKSLDYSNERVQFQTYTHILEGSGVLGGKTVLDVGCGWGNLSIMLYGCGATVTGVDIVPTTIRTLEERFPFISWKTVNLMNRGEVDFLPSYDCIVATEVLQHVDFQTVVNALWAHVQPGGRLVASAPNSACPIAQGVLERYQGLWTPVSATQISQLGETLPEVQKVLMKGLFFREDQQFLPYWASDWNQTIQNTPNRIVFTVIRNT